MSRIARSLCLVVILLLAVPFHAAAQASAPIVLPPTCLPQIQLTDPETHKVTETYLICMPPDELWNGSLVVFAHGYSQPYPPTESPTLPLDQIATPDGVTSLPAMINAMGFGFAMTSYTKNGLAVLEGEQNTIDLVSYVRAMKAPATIQQVFVVGASEGGLITTQLIENHPEVFNGGVAVCGPVGDFQKQINYWGDFRAVFDYYFPTVFPYEAGVSDAVTIPEDPVMIDWVKGLPPNDYTQSTYQSAVISNLSNLLNYPKARSLFGVTRAAYVETDPTTAGATALGILSYNVLATNEAILELGVQPYDNTSTAYSGTQLIANGDAALNAGIRRYTASSGVPAAIAPYQTTGNIQATLITMHNTLDPIVPYWHQTDYKVKVLASGTPYLFADLTIDSYGHCNFKTGQMLYAFARLLHEVYRMPVSMDLIKAILNNDAAAIADFTALNNQYHDVTTVQSYLPAVFNVK